MEQVPVVKKQTNMWVWVIAAIAIILLLLWVFGVFTTVGPAEVGGTTGR